MWRIDTGYPYRTEAKLGDLNSLQELFSGTTPVCRHKHTAAALAEAVIHDQLHVVEWLLEEQAPVDTLYMGMTALHEAVQGNHPGMVELLLRHGFSVNARASGPEADTAVHLAMKNNLNSILLMLSREKPDMTARAGNPPLTPLQLAALTGNSESFEILARPEDYDLDTGECQEYPIFLAVRSGNHCLLDHYITRGGNAHVKTFAGKSLLHVAADCGRADMVRTLLNVRGVDVNVVCMLGRTPLHQAVKEGHGAVCRILLDHGADIYARIPGSGYDAVQYAAKLNKINCFRHMQEYCDVTYRDRKGNTLLHVAAQLGSVPVVRFLLEDPKDLDLRNWELETPLHVAVKCGQDAVVKLLVESGTYGVDKRAGTQATTPLHEAVRAQKTSTFQLLLSLHADTKILDAKSRNIMHYAAEIGSEKCIEMMGMLDDPRGFNLPDATDEADTPLDTAARRGHTGFCRWLLDVGTAVNWSDCSRIPLTFLGAHCPQTVGLFLEYGADPNLRVRRLGGVTVLHEAIHRGNVRLVVDLVRRGCNVHVSANYTRYLGKECLKHLKRRHCEDDREVRGEAIHLASRVGDITSLICLLNAGVSVNVVDNNECTPLHLAVSAGNTSMVYCLLSRCANLLAADAKDRTPLHVAAMKGHLEIVKILLKAGADPNLRNREECDTAMHSAVREDQLECLKAMVAAEGNVHVNESDGAKSLLSTAACSGSEKCLLWLIQHKLPFQFDDEHGLSPLHHAARQGCLEAVDALLDRGAEIDRHCGKGSNYTALHLAIESRNVAMAKKLLLRGADVSKFTDSGHSPFHLAAMHNLQQLVNLMIRKHNVDIAQPSRTPEGDQAVHLAAMHGATRVLQQLCSSGQAEARNSAGHAVLHRLASVCKNVDAVFIVLAAGADVDAVTTEGEGRTALHLAAASNLAAVAEALVNHGADVNAATVDARNSPLHIALKRLNFDVARLLFCRGADVGRRNSRGNDVFDEATSRMGRWLADLMRQWLSGKGYFPEN